MLFTTVFAPAGAAAPALWLVVARAGGMLAVAGAYVAARRLAGPVAAIVAACALVLDVPFVRVVWLGDSEGLLVAAVLFAFERHLAGARRTAFGLGVAAALLRPETWPFVAAYGLWLARRDPSSRKLLAGAAAGVALLWFGPELWGSGQLWRSAARARQPTGGAATFAPDPTLAVIERARLMLIGPVKAAAVFALLVAVVRWHEPVARRVLALAAATALWLAIVAAMTVHGFSGNERYVMAPMAIVCVLAGVGAATIAGVAQRLLATRGRPATALAVACIAAAGAGAVPYVAGTTRALGRQAATLEYQASLRTGMARAIARVGGRERVARCGAAATEDYSVPMLAWYLHEHLAAVLLDPPSRGVVFQARPTPGAPPDPRLRGRRLRYRFQAGPVRVFSRCGQQKRTGQAVGRA